MGLTADQVGNDIFLFGGYAGNAFASSALGFEGVGKLAFNIASFGNSDNGRLVGNEIFFRELADFVFDDFGTSGVAVLFFDLD